MKKYGSIVKSLRDLLKSADLSQTEKELVVYKLIQAEKISLNTPILKHSLESVKIVFDEYNPRWKCLFEKIYGDDPCEEAKLTYSFPYKEGSYSISFSASSWGFPIRRSISIYSNDEKDEYDLLKQLKVILKKNKVYTLDDFDDWLEIVIWENEIFEKKLLVILDSIEYLISTND